MKDFPLIPHTSHGVIVHTIGDGDFRRIARIQLELWPENNTKEKHAKTNPNNSKENQMKSTPHHNTMKHKGQLPGLCCPQ